MHNRCISNHQVAVFESVSHEDHAAALCPGGTVGVSLTRKHLSGHIRAWRCGRLPAVAKSQGTGRHYKQVLAYVSLEDLQLTHMYT